MQTEKRHPIARALHIIGFGRTTLNNYIYGPGAVLSAILGMLKKALVKSHASHTAARGPSGFRAACTSCIRMDISG